MVMGSGGWGFSCRQTPVSREEREGLRHEMRRRCQGERGTKIHALQRWFSAAVVVPFDQTQSAIKDKKRSMLSAFHGVPLIPPFLRFPPDLAAQTTCEQEI